MAPPPAMRIYGELSAMMHLVQHRHPQQIGASKVAHLFWADRKFHRAIVIGFERFFTLSTIPWCVFSRAAKSLSL
jgi:hypothetical protein